MQTAKLFRNGRSQAVRLPREFRFEGEHVLIRKSGDTVILLPATRSWDPLIRSLSRFSADFMAERKQPGPQKRGQAFE